MAKKTKSNSDKDRRKVQYEYCLEELDKCFERMIDNLGNRKYLVGYKGRIKNILKA